VARQTCSPAAFLILLSTVHACIHGAGKHGTIQMEARASTATILLWLREPGMPTAQPLYMLCEYDVFLIVGFSMHVYSAGFRSFFSCVGRCFSDRPGH
jgi:hypothetical protein